MRYLALTVLVLLSLLSPAVAQGLGPVVTKSCVARTNTVTVDTAGAAIPAANVISYKIYRSQTASTGGPATPPPGSTVILAAGPSAPVCADLLDGQQYSLWWAAIDTPPAPGVPAEGPPGPAFPFSMEVPTPPTPVPAAPTNPTMTR